MARIEGQILFESDTGTASGGGTPEINSNEINSNAHEFNMVIAGIIEQIEDEDHRKAYLEGLRSGSKKKKQQR